MRRASASCAIEIASASACLHEGEKSDAQRIGSNGSSSSRTGTDAAAVTRGAVDELAQPIIRLTCQLSVKVHFGPGGAEDHILHVQDGDRRAMPARERQ